MRDKMKNISVSNDIIPVGEFKSKLAFYLKEIQAKKNALVITQNGKPAGVLLSPGEFDELTQSKLFTESVARGLADSENGDVYTTAQLKDLLKKNRK
jgi:prevent-host-death family protein